MKHSTKRLAVFALSMAFGFLSMLPFIAAAYAQTASVPVHAAVDFSGAANNVITAVTVVLTGLAAWVSKFAVGWLSSKAQINDTQFEAMMAQRVDDVLQRAIDYASTKAKAWAADPTNPLEHVTFNNFFLDAAVNYALNAMPDLIKYFNLTEVRIQAMIEARMNAFLATPVPNSGVLKTVDAATVVASVPPAPPSVASSVGAGMSASTAAAISG